MDDILDGSPSTEEKSIKYGENVGVKVLGMWWDPCEDQLRYRANAERMDENIAELTISLESSVALRERSGRIHTRRRI